TTRATVPPRTSQMIFSGDPTAGGSVGSSLDLSRRRGPLRRTTSSSLTGTASPNWAPNWLTRITDWQRGQAAGLSPRGILYLKCSWQAGHVRAGMRASPRLVQTDRFPIPRTASASRTHRDQPTPLPADPIRNQRVQA